MICHHFELFHGEILNYVTYDKEPYALVHAIKKWKKYLMSKETIIHQLIVSTILASLE